jgi:superfamily I DNA and/or RNA helicase
MQGFDWPIEGEPIAFIDIKGEEADSTFGTTKSKINETEAQVVMDIVIRLVKEGGVEPKRIGIISPYLGQVKLITDKFHSFSKHNGAEDLTKFSKLSIHTVDGFQGREKDVVVFSAVRSNKNGKVGFLKDWRRLNVALTRAIR